MGKYLDFYKKCMETGRMPSSYLDGQLTGLCGTFGKKALEIFVPTPEDRRKYDVGVFGYWASDDEYLDRSHAFTKMRQNIVLFLAAMSGEDFNELKK